MLVGPACTERRVAYNRTVALLSKLKLESMSTPSCLRESRRERRR